MKNWDRGGGLEFICIQMHLVRLAHVKNNVNLKNVKLPKRLQFISLGNYLKILCKKVWSKTQFNWRKLTGGSVNLNSKADTSLPSNW